LILVNIGDLPRGVGGFLALRVTVEKVLLLLIFAVCWNRAFTWLGLYRRGGVATPRAEVARAGPAAPPRGRPPLLLRLFSATGAFRLETVSLFWALSIPAILVSRQIVRALGTWVSGRRPREVLIIGTGPRAQVLCRVLRSLNGADDPGASLIGCMD